MSEGCHLLSMPVHKASVSPKLAKLQNAWNLPDCMYNQLYSYTFCTSDPLFSTCTSERRVACHVSWCMLNCV